LDQAGTYWYHSHNMGQYPDGLWGVLIVRGGEPFAGKYDGEFVMTLTDWYHQQMPVMLKQYQSSSNLRDNGGDEPDPDLALINAAPNATFKVEPGKTYLFRIVCVGNFPGHGFIFDQHPARVVEVDGIWVDEYDVGDHQMRMTTGQRMSVLVTMKNSTEKNYAFFDTMDINMMFFNEGKNPPPGFNSNATAWLVYNESASLPAPPVYQVFNFVDDLSYVPVDKQPVLEPVNHQIIIDFNSDNSSGTPRYAINGQTYLTPEVPSLYSAITLNSTYSNNPIVYGHTNPFILKYNDVVEVVVNDYHNNLHPFHLHGHQFQSLVRTDPNAGYYPGYTFNYSATPMRRDTLMVQQGGYAVIRFRADNPGVWLFHCHIEFHTEAGLTATFIEAPERTTNIRIPPDHLDVCRKYGLATAGNSLGNTASPLSNQSYHVPEEDDGFVHAFDLHLSFFLFSLFLFLVIFHSTFWLFHNFFIVLSKANVVTSSCLSVLFYDFFLARHIY
jgi:iron transport multicopper oxidase